jgi:excisionase family DNA binding protein
MSAPAAPVLLSVRDAAARLGFTLDRVYRLVRKKQIPHLRIPGRGVTGEEIFFSPAALDVWQAQRTVEDSTARAASIVRTRVAARSHADEERALGIDPEEVFPWE